MKLTFYKLIESAKIPQMATAGSACFDLEYQTENNYIDVYSPSRTASRERLLGREGEFTLMHGERALIPTGLIANIPEGYSLRMHPRSGKSIKQGLTLVNAEGVIDSDYVEEIMIAMINHGPDVIIAPGDRLCQCELVSNMVYDIGETKKRPVHKTSRKGGFGSTGG